MSLSSKIPGSNLANRLRATAASFTPLGSQGDAIFPLDGQQHDTVTHDNSSPASAASPVSETPRNPNIEARAHVVQPKPELTDGKTDIDCTFCTSIGRLLDCCQARTNSQPCLHCAEFDQLFARENKKHEDETAALHEKLRQLEEESPDQKFKRLCVEKNTKIDGLKREVEKTNKENESLRGENIELEKRLTLVETEIKKAQPPVEFTVKEKKKWKRK